MNALEKAHTFEADYEVKATKTPPRTPGVGLFFGLATQDGFVA